MLYENEVCPGCGQAIAEGDDVVVCPSCATPQHRACWQKDNSCVNASMHAEGYVWHGQSSPPEQEPAAPARQTCPLCNASNKPDALHCEYCGAPLGAGAPPPFFQEAFNVSPDEYIGGEKAQDIAMYVRSSVDRYLRRFRKFSDGGGRLSWNWAAFFLAPFWFFYRRMNKLGIFFAVVLATLTLITAIPLEEFQSVYTQYYDELNSEATTDARLLEIESELVDAMKPVYLFFGVNFLLRVVCATIANKEYYKKMLADLKILHQTSADSQMFRVLLLQNAGTSILGLGLGFFGYEILYQAMLYLSDKIITL